MKTTFSKKDLVKFGNYLLSSERSNKFEERQTGLSIPERKGRVTDADIANFIEKIKEVD